MLAFFKNRVLPVNYPNTVCFFRGEATKSERESHSFHASHDLEKKNKFDFCILVVCISAEEVGGRGERDKRNPEASSGEEEKSK